MAYANFCGSRWERSKLEQCRLREASLAESRLHGLAVKEDDFTAAEFVRTPLAGIDLSDSVLDGIALSDGAPELRGCTVSALQAADLAMFVLQLRIK